MTDWLEKLSADAKVIAGAHFGMLITPGKGHAAYQTPWNLTPRAKAAFDELVEAGVLSVSDGEHGPTARTYRALVDCTPAYDWLRANEQEVEHFEIMAPAKEHRRAPPEDWVTHDQDKPAPQDHAPDTEDDGE